jgi:hypothetical protein
MHVARMRDKKIIKKFCVEDMMGRDLSEDLGVDGRIILKCFLKI